MSALAITNLEPARTSLQDGQELVVSSKMTPATPLPVYLRHLATKQSTGASVPAIEHKTTQVEERPGLATRQVLAHHWECTVESVGPETFVATLRSLKKPTDSEKEAELPLDEVSPDDLELLAPGAVFYWAIGQEWSRGTVLRFSRIKFRRLPGWTKKDIVKVEEEADELFAMFGGKSAHDEAPKR